MRFYLITTAVLILLVSSSMGYDPLSLRSLRLVAITDTDQMTTATGFLIEKDGTEYLITNWHVVSGRDYLTGEPLLPDSSFPQNLRISYICPDIFYWEQRTEPLYANNIPLWLEHPDYHADVVALPLTNIPEDAVLRHVDLALAETDMLVQPSMTVSIIGFPYGESSIGVMPIWKTGTIASEYNWPLSGGEPAFLIDATTRPGMSGSPVFLQRLEGYIEESTGNRILDGSGTKFLGIYSAQQTDAELGIVWKPEVITGILENN